MGDRVEAMQRACARGTVVVAAGADAVWFGGMEGAGDAGALAGLCELLKMRQLTLSPFPFAHLRIVHARGRHERNRRNASGEQPRPRQKQGVRQPSLLKHRQNQGDPFAALNV